MGLSVYAARLALALSLAICTGSVSSFAASLPIQRAVLSSDAASFSARARAGPCSAAERLPIWRSAQFTAFFTKLRGSVECFSISAGTAGNPRRARSCRERSKRQGARRRRGARTRAVFRPLRDLLFHMRRADEELAGHLIAQVPGIEFRHPGVHLRRRHLLRLIDERGEDARLVHAARPKRRGKFVVAFQPPLDRPEAGHRDAVSARGVDAEARLSGAVLLRAERLQLGEDRLRFLAVVSRRHLRISCLAGQRNLPLEGRSKSGGRSTADFGRGFVALQSSPPPEVFRPLSRPSKLRPPLKGDVKEHARVRLHFRSSSAIRLDVSQRCPPIDCTSE